MSMEMVSFTKEIDKLDKALSLTSDTKKLAEKIQEKGFFSALTGGISGKTSKELAGAVKDLGASVEITQKILSLFLKTSNLQNIELKKFSEGLGKKIMKLDKETETCDSNIIESKKATLVIVKQLKSQIDERLKQDEVILYLRKKSSEKEILDNEQTADITFLKAKANEKNILDDKQTVQINKLKKEISNLKRPKNIFSIINFLLILILFYLLIMG